MKWVTDYLQKFSHGIVEWVKAGREQALEIKKQNRTYQKPEEGFDTFPYRDLLILLAQEWAVSEEVNAAPFSSPAQPCLLLYRCG